jgi:hypothetical protein
VLTSVTVRRPLLAREGPSRCSSGGADRSAGGHGVACDREFR